MKPFASSRKVRSGVGGALSGLFVWAVIGVGWTAPPTLDALMPSGGKAGSEAMELTLTGKSDPWPISFWCSNPKVSFSAGEKAGVCQVSIKPDSPVGPCWVRSFNAEGVSDPRLFVVGKWREMQEDAKTENDNAASAIDVGALPVVVNGKLEKSDDVDAWKVSLKAGQTLHARLDGYSLRSGIDPFLHLSDANGVRLATGSDNPRNLDPRLEVPITRDGDYVVSIMAIASPPNANINFHGAAGAVWRLTLATEPITEESSGVGDIDESGADTLPPSGEMVLNLPLTGWGTLTNVGETDRIRFSAVKGQAVRIAVEAMKHGFPTDPVLVLEKADGSTIREVDDTKTDRDAEYLYTIPADGDYAVKVADRFGRGGKDLRYQLEINESKPDFVARPEKSAFSGKPGETVGVKLAITRTAGHVAPISVAVDGLPKGVKIEPLVIAEKVAAGELKVTIAADAEPFSGPISIKLTEKVDANPKTHLASFTFQDANARGPYLIDEIDSIWLSVLPKPEKDDKKN